MRECFFAGMLADPWVGVITGLLGALLTSSQVGIPFIVGGTAILGGVVGYLTFKGFRPLIASIVALVIELPYVAATDLVYVQWPIVQILLVKWTGKVLVSAAMASLIVRSTAINSLMSGLRT